MITITTDMPIIGGPQVPQTLLRSWLLVRRRDMLAAVVDDIVATYTTVGMLSRIGNLLLFSHAVHETGAFSSERWVKSYNPAGLGATNDGAWGATFANMAEGVTAQAAHLLAYAGTDAQLTPAQRLLVAFDPRLVPMTQKWGRGCAPRWVDLNGKWAVPGTTYGQRILVLARQIAGS